MVCTPRLSLPPAIHSHPLPSPLIPSHPLSRYILYLVGTVPAGISNCYKQRCLKGVDLEVMYAALWSGNWQIVWGLLLFPINWVPLPAYAHAEALITS